MRNLAEAMNRAKRFSKSKSDLTVILYKLVDGRFNFSPVLPGGALQVARYKNGAELDGVDESVLHGDEVPTCLGEEI